MKTDIGGKLRNADVPKSKPLLPVFEAIVNSFQSLEDLDQPECSIEIELMRVPVLVDPDRSEITRVIIRDNGPGFDDENFEHFTLAETRHKVSIGGKGIGRFTWLNVFDRAEITSIFQTPDGFKERRFIFSPTQDPEENVKTTDAGQGSPLTTVSLCILRPPFTATFPTDLEVITQQVIEHCFLLLARPNAPAVTLIDGKQRIDLVEFCRKFAIDRAYRKSFKVEGQAFEYIGLRLYGQENEGRREHKIHFTAHGRSVLSQRLRSCVPNLRGYTRDEANQPFIYTAFIQGEFLDKNVNENRTDFKCHSTIAEKLLDDTLFPEPSIEEVRNSAMDLLQVDLKTVLERLTEQKLERIQQVALAQPEYRHLLKRPQSFIDKISPSAGKKEIESILNDELHSRKVKTREETRKVLSKLSKESESKQEEILATIMEQITDLEKSALAEYVAHRKLILQFLEKSLGIDPDTGRHRLEKVLHQVVFPMQTTSGDEALDNQNLWLVDERLTYHVYLASDKAFRQMAPLDSGSPLRPDILVFDKAQLFDRTHVLGESGSYPIDSFIVIEFKRPLHTDYRDDNPITQVYAQIRQIRQEHFKDRRGREIKLRSPDVPAYVYIICDLTDDVIQYAEDANLTRTPDRMGFFGFNNKPTINAYVEIISYDKLISDAKKRNRTLFDKLGLPTTYSE